MKSILTTTEKTLGWLYYIGYGLFIIWYILEDTPENPILETSGIDQNLFLYILVISFLFPRLVKEIIVYIRLRHESVECISDNLKWFEIVKLVLVLGAHVAFWVLILSEESVYFTHYSLNFLIMTTCFPHIASKRIYGTTSYIVYDCIYYYFDEIDRWSVSEVGTITFNIEDKPRYLSTRSKKQLDDVVCFLENQMPIQKSKDEIDKMRNGDII